MAEYAACLLRSSSPADGGEGGGGGGGGGAEGRGDAAEAGPAAAAAAAPLRPGWCYQLWSYGPVSESGEGGAAAASGLEQALSLHADAVRASAAAGASRVSGDAARGLLCLHLSRNMVEGSTGCFDWDPGFALAEVLLSHPEMARGEAGRRAAEGRWDAIRSLGLCVLGVSVVHTGKY